MVYNAAMGGSDLGAYFIGLAYLQGINGVSKNKVEAKKWLRKAVGGKCKFCHSSEKCLKNAKYTLQIIKKSR